MAFPKAQGLQPLGFLIRESIWQDNEEFNAKSPRREDAKGKASAQLPLRLHALAPLR